MLSLHIGHNMVSHPIAYHILRSSFANTSWLLITSSQCQWSVVFQKTETELVVRDGQRQPHAQCKQSYVKV